MKPKSLGLAAIALTCAVGLTPILSGSAFAGSTPAASPAQLHALLKGSGPTGSGTVAGGASPAIATGWNYGHCYAAIYYTPDNTNYYEYAFNVEGSYLYFAVNSPLGSLAGQNISAACRMGHEYAWYVVNSSTGAYSEIQVGF